MLHNKVFLAAALSASFTLTAIAGAMADTIVVSDQHARPSLGVSRISAGFLTLKNNGSEDDRLISVDSDVAERVELHTHINDKGVMRMRQVKSIPVKADDMTMLKPGGYHIMFIKTAKQLKVGDSFKIKLNFAKAKPVSITMPVTKIMGHGMMMKKKTN